MRIIISFTLMEEAIIKQVDLGTDTLVQVDIIPGDEDFTILIGGVNSGTLYHTGEGWRWKDGNLDQNAADKIGDVIESHYM